ncbi:uncharacterized protein BDV17DRAFT_293834 [Aspergillus undulatus]|uniref:uncharacterized protein n=1 Tax=Aspergillus undulatus TaxID=1810928 RepID=UPI003CCD5C01
MRFPEDAVQMAIFAATTLGHETNCAGKAMAAPLYGLNDALDYLGGGATRVEWYSGIKPPKERILGPNSCEALACSRGAEVKLCNGDTKSNRKMHVQHIADRATAILNELLTTHKGKKVAGGVITHPDKCQL